ncbi:DUF4190 domain-containing protein [Ruminococcus sp. OA3]|uniref:DUF4190 domain-containing protein n=1 Tax=Ruminococcus sp. OA3 TaxID=2914164 RepID=UPI001F06D2C9|nr:DUF4190 domain-containing protein [Ruminococcus sp. OA3]MCH1981028.1 DUF4190 domain-containing protein [Ruminococcus sp. OA3]
MEQNTNFNENPQQDYYYQNRQEAPPPASSSPLSTASLVLGICSLVLICCGGSFILGALGIIFAILSRGRTPMNGTAKAGLALSIIGIVLSITVYTFYIVSFVSSGEFDNVLRGYEYYYHNGEDDYYDDYDGDDYLDDLLRRYQDGLGQGGSLTEGEL